MSGGAFNYKNHHIMDIADEIERIIAQNDCLDRDKWGDIVGRRYSAETIAEMVGGFMIMKAAAIYAHRIDWLLSGDDGEEQFIDRLNEELDELYED